MRLLAANGGNWKRLSGASSSSTRNLASEHGSGKTFMSVPDFLDSNVLVYAHDDTDLRKKEIAQGLLRRAVLGEFVASTQSLAEFATTLLHKFSPPFPPKDVLAILDSLSPIKLMVPDGGVVRRAVEAREAYGIHFYDG